jgi:hypothetical protein
MFYCMEATAGKQFGHEVLLSVCVSTLHVYMVFLLMYYDVHATSMYNKHYMQYSY